MDNLALQIIDEQLGLIGLCDSMTGESGFVIDNDNKAEWALKKLSEENAETQRFINVCQTMINEYQFKIQKANEQHKVKADYLRQLLQQYFETVPHKSTKTQETYKLPSGTLKLKYQKPEYVRDEEKLLKWLKDNGYTDFIKVKESPNWASLKENKELAVSGSNVLYMGEIVEGVTAQERPPVFDIDI